MPGPPSHEAQAASKRPRDDDENSLSRSQLERIQTKAKQEVLTAVRSQLAIKNGPPQGQPGQGQSAAAKKQARRAATAAAGGAGPLALANGGVGDGGGGGAGGKGGKGKGKDAGGGKGKGKGACYAWNDGNPCAGIPRPHKHICSKCCGSNQRGECPKQ